MKIQDLYRYLIIIVAFIPIRLKAQGLSELCQTDYFNYSHQWYKAHRQNWGVSQNHKTGFMYFANSKGLLEFDGTNWKIFPLPNKQIVRSVLCTNSGKIFTGSLGEFGYWQTKHDGQLKYHSLRGQIKEPSFAQEEIWHILEIPNGILFQSFAVIYLYKNNQLKKLNAPGNILFVFEVKGRYFLQVLNEGIFELVGEKFIFLAKSDVLKNESVHTILPTDKANEILIGTNRGLYLFDGKKMEIFNQKSKQFFQQNQINAGIRLPSGQYLFGTILNGLVFTDKNGNLISHFNRKNGLQNNTVLSMTSDLDGNIWLGLDNGISMLALSSPFRYFDEIEGELGTVFDAEMHDNFLYLATNHGVFYNNIQKPFAKFKLLRGTENQTWDLQLIDNQLFCGHNNGTFVIENFKIIPLSSITGGLVIKKIKNYPDYLLQGTYTKLCLYKKDDNGKFKFLFPIENFSAPIKKIEEIGSNEYLVQTLNDGIYHLWLSEDFRKVIKHVKIQVLGEVENLSRLNNQVFISTMKGLYVYDTMQNKLIRNQSLNLKDTKRIFQLNKNNLWILKHNSSFGFIDRTNVWNEIPLKTGNWVDDYENVLLFDSTMFFCKENGFAILDEKNIPSIIRKNKKNPLIRAISVDGAPELTKYFYSENDALDSFEFKYDQNSVKFLFSSSDFTSSIKFSYFLENFSDDWSAYSDIPFKEFNNLQPGSYVFHLKTNMSGRDVTLKFIISEPWYWNFYSKSVYFLIIMCLSWFLYKVHLKRLSEQNQKLLVEKETELKKQQEKNKQEIIRLRNEQLEQDVLRKSEELANSTMQLIKKNELLIKLKAESQHIEAQTKKGMLSQMIKLIDKNISSEQDWHFFEQNFTRVHEAFFKKLLEKFPDLSQGD